MYIQNAPLGSDRVKLIKHPFVVKESGQVAFCITISRFITFIPWKLDFSSCTNWWGFTVQIEAVVQYHWKIWKLIAMKIYTPEKVCIKILKISIKVLSDYLFNLDFSWSMFFVRFSLVCNFWDTFIYNNKGCGSWKLILTSWAIHVFFPAFHLGSSQASRGSSCMDPVPWMTHVFFSGKPQDPCTVNVP